MIDTVIFDMDGVIIDSEPIHMEVEQELFKELGIIISKERHLTFVGTSSKNMWEMLRTEHGLHHTVEELVDRNKRTFRQKVRAMSLQPIAGVRELILGLKAHGTKVALASSSTPEDIEMVLELFNLRSYFQELVSGSHVPFSKPHPEIFLRTAQLLKSNPINCLVIEDSENGVRAAKAAGMICVGYQNINSGNQNLTQADKIIHSFQELSVDSIVNFKV